MSKFTKKLERELKTNPKKAAILGGLVLVAGYFWAPLVAGWFGQKQPPIIAAAGSPSIAATNEPTAATAMLATTLSWRTLAKLMEQDQTMKSTPVAERNPLEPVVSEVKEVVVEKVEEPVVAVVEEIDPQSLGMKLSSTIVGNQRSLAQINGRSYRVGQSIGASKDDSHANFILKSIGPRFVVLERLGKTYTVRMSDPSTASAKDAKSSLTSHQSAASGDETELEEN